MKKIVRKVLQNLKVVVDRYPVLIAALVIYLYYLVTSLNFFGRQAEKRSFVDYIMQFDSLFFLWIAAAVFLQWQKMRKAYKQEEDHRHNIERVLDRQEIYSTLIKDITMMLQDNVNNPLAVISVTTQEIRRRFEKDPEIMRWLDRIDGAMSRIHNTIRDLQAYESQKLIETSQEAVRKKS
ncbi:MAG: hypothetical protein HY707_09975 [Ignavibacteriae bacterium]|nr:hypothetical protein [Ignavibacteriota bacterium]